MSAMDIDVGSSDLGVSINWVAPPSRLESTAAGLYEIYGQEGNLWVIHNWQPTSNTPIESFLERWPPSRTSKHSCA